jgi:alginate O-acetyltransferase complex protein AlgI
MLFTTLDFAVFFFAFYICYWLSQNNLRVQNGILALASYIFYGWIHPYFCLLLFASTLIDFFCARGIQLGGRYRRLLLVLSITGNLAILGTFKYYDFFLENIVTMLIGVGLEVGDPIFLSLAVPVGISFYTFQSMSYSIDVYRGKCDPVHDFLPFAVFVSMFPQLVAGPIERASSLLPQILKKRENSAYIFAMGVDLFLRGLLLKLVVANNVALISDRIFLLSSPSTTLLWIGSLAFGIQIYCDFLGYTLMARGVGCSLGFRLSENFNSPYLSATPSEFWRRWHISLSTFVRDYLYIPLGGGTGTSLRQAVVLVATMALMGLWHGADWKFVIWGLYHGIMLVLYRNLGLGAGFHPKQSRYIFVGVWFILTLVGWMIFRCPDVFWLWDAVTTTTASSSRLKGVIFLTLMLGMYSAPLIYLKIADRVCVERGVWRGISAGFTALAIVLYSADSTREFIYFQF